MKDAAIFASAVTGMSLLGSLVLVVADAIKNHRYQRNWDKHVDAALKAARQ